MSGRPQRLPGPECRNLRFKYMIRKLLLLSLLTVLLQRCAPCMPPKAQQVRAAGRHVPQCLWYSILDSTMSLKEP